MVVAGADGRHAERLRRAAAAVPRVSLVILNGGGRGRRIPLRSGGGWVEVLAYANVRQSGIRTVYANVGQSGIHPVYTSEVQTCKTVMNKASISARLPELVLGKLQQIARDHYNGDRTAALTHLLTLGIESFEEGKQVTAPKYDLPEAVILAIEVEVSKEVKALNESLMFRVDCLQSKLEILEERLDKKKRG